MRAVLPLACVLALASFGCGDDPIVIVPDDTGGGGTDAGTDAPSTPVDAPTTPTCPPEAAPPPAPDACAASTFTCLRTATTQAAQMACIDADPAGAACLGCLNQEIFATCTSGAAMCADEFGLIQCCLEEACPTGDMACLQTASAAGGACATEVMNMIACVNTEQGAMRCGISETLCFADAPAPSPFFPDFGGRRFEWSPREVRWSGVFAD